MVSMTQGLSALFLPKSCRLKLAIRSVWLADSSAMSEGWLTGIEEMVGGGRDF
jgi:hypothetical protein